MRISSVPSVGLMITSPAAAAATAASGANSPSRSSASRAADATWASGSPSAACRAADRFRPADFTQKQHAGVPHVPGQAAVAERLDQRHDVRRQRFAHAGQGQIQVLLALR